MRTESTLNSLDRYPGRTMIRLKMWNSKQSFTVKVETRKVILFPKSVSFALQVELRPDSVQRDRPSLTGPSGS